MVEQNFDILKTIQSLQGDLKSFIDDNMIEINEQQVINEALLWNMIGVIPQGKTTHSTNMSKKQLYHKWDSILREKGKEEHTHEIPHNPSSDDSLSPCRNKHRNDDNFQGEFKKIKAPTYEG